RMQASGRIDVKLDLDHLRQAVSELLERGVDALAVGFLHSYANPEHEQRAAKLISEMAPEVDVSLSSDVHREYREYDRVVTTVANAYVMPTVARHLAGLQEKLEERNLDCSVNIVRSDGGVMSAEAAAGRPIDTVFSGPSGGVEGALASVRSTGLTDILTLDMGGTSTDVSVCLGGKVAVARETIVAELPLKAPSVDVRSIGAGGGSIAQVPSSINSLRVGPESAGADPGPACYGRGGTAPTVTDANLVLGRLPTGLLGGGFPLDLDAATSAVSVLAEKLDLSVEDTARGILDIVNEKMAAALRVMSVERGLDPRNFALVAFGGAGPLHANALAELLGCYPVVVPLFPGVLSAQGFHAAGKRSSFSRTMIRAVNAQAWSELEGAIRSVGELAHQWLVVEGETDGKVHFTCDMRFVRQGYEVEVPFEEAEITETRPERLADRFRDEHQRLYGFTPEAEVEVVTVRADARCPSGFELRESSPGASRDPASAQVSTNLVTFADPEPVETAVYERGKLSPGMRLEG
ncbi:MAG: hydantoinase/oxoprolinase family protein, partial [Solirubrobacterales bacterium]